MADNLLEQLDEDVTNVFLDTGDYGWAGTVTRTALDGTTTTGIPAAFEFQVGAVDEKERAVFRVRDNVAWQRGDYVTFESEQWTVIDIRPDSLGILELRCDKPEVTA